MKRIFRITSLQLREYCFDHGGNDMTETMKNYFEQIVMDLDFAAMNADAGWEIVQFYEEVRDEVLKRIAVQTKDDSAIELPEEPKDIEEVIGNTPITAKDVSFLAENGLLSERPSPLPKKAGRK